MANKYPNPCDTCQSAATCRVGCLDWQIRYRYRQKQINAYRGKIMQNKTTQQTKFIYQHPDDIRRYLADGPSKGCDAETECDTPCPDYLRWYDARMQVIRKKVET